MKPMHLVALLVLGQHFRAGRTVQQRRHHPQTGTRFAVSGPEQRGLTRAGRRNPPVKNGVAYVGASHSQGDWAIGLSPKLPLSLNLDRTQGDAQLDLRSLRLTSLSLKQSLGNLDLKLPAANLKAVLDQQQGDTTITLPPNTGIRVEAGRSNRAH